jgi:solute carrier family 15 (peptide/histidine transporter), member 3/4
VLMLICFPAFLAGSRVYRFREMGVSPITSLLQVVVAAVRKWNAKLPDDSSLLYEQASSPCTTEASHKNKHTNQFR